ncbi:MAG: phosphatase PAP2 family protein [Bacteroidaceae bacterium]|nr:phosphatase PAP2 family protein [Bacteroidaceae bacterium]
MMRRFCLFLTFYIGTLCAHAQVEPIDSTYLAQMDSIIVEYERMQQVQKVIKQYEEMQLKREMSFRTDGTLAVVRGLLLSWTDHHFMKHSAQFEPKGDVCNWRDYAVGGMPLLANWTLKAAGVKSRSKLERMLTANAMAFGISFGVSEALKHSVSETRPDLSNNHSFPSGHASFAFVSATILSREYGYISPWITMGSYVTAAGTELLRVKHNKHWMSDLYMGAGIGVMSTNLAYFLTDKIFGADAINKPEVRRRDIMRLLNFNAKPSGVSLVTGTEIGNRKIHFDDATVKSGAAISAGADVTWHLSSQFALELMTRVVDAQVKVFPTGQNADDLYTGGQLDIYHIDVAAKYAYPMGLSRRMGARAFVGTRILNGTTLSQVLTTNSTSTLPKTYTIPNEAKFEMGFGITYDCLDADNYAWGFTADYYHTFSHYMKNRYSISSVVKILF